MWLRCGAEIEAVGIVVPTLPDLCGVFLTQFDVHVAKSVHKSILKSARHQCGYGSRAQLRYYCFIPECGGYVRAQRGLVPLSLFAWGNIILLDSNYQFVRLKDSLQFPQRTLTSVFGGINLLIV